MEIKVGSFVRVKDLRVMDHDVEPYISSNMYVEIDKTYEVMSSSLLPHKDEYYFNLKGSKFYWNKDWLEVLPEHYKYQDLVRLDRKWSV